ncbi:DNA repair protein RadC [uncultured Eubacterium sp.]|uniref:RadC family protein n=1 Tax=uncultured Eubacterium sp. TaxID=165185 RepID=UPI002671AA59|nr:DNA repair protein RadC [uncultured Eubacterium sp.]
MKKIKDIPQTERPYEKCFSSGPEVLSDCELLSVILRTGTNGSSAYDLANEILTDEGGKINLLSVMHISKEELLQIKGMGMVKTVQILCLGELAKRISIKPFHNNVKYDSPQKIAGFFMEKMRHLEQETLNVMFLDVKCKLIKDKELTRGTISQSLVCTREIFVEALKCNAANIVLIHNHPSGEPTPSKDDIKSTLKIREAGILIGITLLDHIIIGDNKFSSLKELKFI